MDFPSQLAGLRPDEGPSGALGLEKLELPFELVGLDHPAGELDTPSYRHLSSFAQIPVLEDESVVLSESGAILIYLAKSRQAHSP
jgi:glutathione S-transferase